MSDGLHILAGVFTEQDLLDNASSYTFEAKITQQDRPLGRGCPVYIFNKATGLLCYTTETDLDSKVYIPNLQKNLRYLVVATDTTDEFNTVTFDLTWDFAKSSGSNYSLKYYNKIENQNIKDIYTYFDTYANQQQDRNLVYSFSEPLIKEDQGSLWLSSGTILKEYEDGLPAFLFLGTSYTYLRYFPLQQFPIWTIECYVKPYVLATGKTVAGSLFSHDQKGLFINEDRFLTFVAAGRTLEVPVQLEAAVFTHIAVTYDKTTLTIFVNGQIEAIMNIADVFQNVQSLFSIGSGYYGALAGFRIFSSVKYEEEFTPSFQPTSYKPVAYSEPDDPFANQTVLKTVVTPDGFIKDQASNIALNNVFNTPQNSFISSNNGTLFTAAAYERLSLSSDFTLELSFRLRGRAGSNPILVSNTSDTTEWTSNHWHLHADHPTTGAVAKYLISKSGVPFATSNLIANYPVRYNEPVHLVLQRRGSIWTYYVNGFKDRVIEWNGTLDSRTTSFFRLGGDLYFDVYSLSLTQAAKYTEDTHVVPSFTDTPYLMNSFYELFNLPLKRDFISARSAFKFVSNNVRFSSERSSYLSYSAFFNNASLTSVNASTWYTPNEKFTIELKFSVHTLPIEEDDIAVILDIYKTTSVIQVGIVGDKLGLFVNDEWLVSEVELTNEETFTHIALQRDGSVLKLLCNGATVLTANMPAFSQEYSLCLGRAFNATNPFHGYVNNFKAYKNICKYTDSYEVEVDPDESDLLSTGELEPEVVVLPYTTSALDFENALIDRVTATVWQSAGSASTTNNAIFGEQSFETKALGDTLYTSSNILTGGATPFTIEFYALIKGRVGFTNAHVAYPLLMKNGNNASADNGFVLEETVGRKSRFVRLPDTDVYGTQNINLNETYKFTCTYDGSALRWFVNDRLDFVHGTSVGFDISREYPYQFFIRDVASQSGTLMTTLGLLDNINIHNNLATTVRNPDINEEHLVVDLALEGPNNSVKIVENGNGSHTWAVSGNAKLSTSQPLDGYSSLALGTGCIRTTIPEALGLQDFTISFDVRTPSFSGYPRFFQFGNNLNNGALILYGINGSNLIHAQIYVNGSYMNVVAISVSSYSHNKWNKITFARKDGVFYFYINGKLAERFYNATDYNISSRVLTIGANSINSEQLTNSFIKNFKLYKGIAIPPESPLGQIQLDFKKANLDDTYGNSTWTNNGASFSTPHATLGYTLDLLGSSDKKISTGPNLNLDFTTNNFKMEFDVKRKAELPVSALLSSNVSTYTVPYTSYVMLSKDTLAVGTTLTAGTTYEFKANCLDLLDVMYNNVIVRKNNYLHFYKNDVLYWSERVNNYQFNFNNNTGTTIGKAAWATAAANSFDGYLDSFKTHKAKDPLENILGRNAAYSYANDALTVERISSGWSMFRLTDMPAIKDGIIEAVYVNNKHSVFNIALRTTMDMNSISSAQYAYLFKITHDGQIFFVKGTNSSASGSAIVLANSTIDLPQGRHKLKIVMDNTTFTCYCNDVLVCSVTDTTHTLAAAPFLAEYMDGSLYYQCIESLKLSTLNEAEIYDRSWKSEIEAPITQTAVHLPLATNANNIGFCDVTVNTIGAPTYHVLDGKQCVKLETGKYFTINNHSIFNLDVTVDFYLEFDFYIDTFNSLSHTMLLNNNTHSTSNGSMYFSVSPSSEGVYGNKLVFHLQSSNFSHQFRTKNEPLLGSFNNVKLIRKDNVLTLLLNDVDDNHNVASDYQPLTADINKVSFNMSNNGLFFGLYSQYSSSVLPFYLSDFKMFVGTPEVPASYDPYTVIDLDFKPTKKAYLFKDNAGKCIIHPVNITQRDYQGGQYCCTFDGSSQYLQLGKNSLLNLGYDDFVIAIEFKQSQIRDGMLLTSYSSSNVPTRCALDIKDNKIRFFTEPALNANDALLSVNEISNDSINTLIVYRVRGVLYIVLNDEVTTKPFNHSLNFNLGSNTFIGTYIRGTASSPQEFNFAGTLYSFKILRNTSDLYLLNSKKIN